MAVPLTCLSVGVTSLRIQPTSMGKDWGGSHSSYCHDNSQAWSQGSRFRQQGKSHRHAFLLGSDGLVKRGTLQSVTSDP